MDKQLLLLVIFVAFFLFAAAIVASGVIPQIFQQTNQLHILNQTLMNQYEDEARERQTAHQDEVIRTQSRSLLTNITNETKLLVSDMFYQFTKYIDKQNNTTQRSLENQVQILN